MPTNLDTKDSRDCSTHTRNLSDHSLYMSCSKTVKDPSLVGTTITCLCLSHGRATSLRSVTCESNLLAKLRLQNAGESGKGRGGAFYWAVQDLASWQIQDTGSLLLLIFSGFLPKVSFWGQWLAYLTVSLPRLLPNSCGLWPWMS